MQSKKYRDAFVNYFSKLSSGSMTRGKRPTEARASSVIKAHTGALVLFAMAAVGAHAEASHYPRADSGIVKIDSGLIEGTTANGANAYLGIPYAAPPVAGLRWRPPQPPPAWRTTLQAVKFGKTCAQTTDFGDFSSPSTDEDCLYLNVYTPPGAVTHKGKLP